MRIWQLCELSMEEETREGRRSRTAGTSIDPAPLCPQEDRVEEIKMSERSECMSFQNHRCRSSPRVAILCACIGILVIAFIVSIVFNIVVRSPGKEDQQQCSDTDVPAPCGPACPSGWIGYEGKCYFFSEGGKNWTSSQSFCTSYGSSLAVIENEPEKVFIVRYKCHTDHWIGLRKDTDHSWKWADGTALNGTLEVKGEGGDCAFLNSGFAVSSRCYIQRNWICSHHDAYASHKNASIRR